MTPEAAVQFDVGRQSIVVTEEDRLPVPAEHKLG
jgi:hypothetical protein